MGVNMTIVNYCQECDKSFRNAKAFAGHMWLAHHKRVGAMKAVDDAIAELHSVVNAWTSQEFDKRLERVEDAIIAMSVGGNNANLVKGILAGSKWVKAPARREYTLPLTQVALEQEIKEGRHK